MYNTCLRLPFTNRKQNFRKEILMLQSIPQKSFREGWKPKLREISIPFILLIFTGFNALCGGLIFIGTMFSTMENGMENPCWIFKYGKKIGKYKGFLQNSNSGQQQKSSNDFHYWCHLSVFNDKLCVGITREAPMKGQTWKSWTIASVSFQPEFWCSQPSVELHVLVINFQGNSVG